MGLLWAGSSHTGDNEQQKLRPFPHSSTSPSEQERQHIVPAKKLRCGPCLVTLLPVGFFTQVFAQARWGRFFL